MKTVLANLGRILVTLVFVCIAGFAGWRLYAYYMLEPWTRDGRLRAIVIELAPDVSGLVDKVLVGDNAEVEAGQIVLQIDKARFELAVRQAEASLQNKQATLEQAQRDAERTARLTSNVISVQEKERAQTEVDEGTAAVAQAQVELDIAKLNLDRADVRAPASGILANFELKPGNYVSAGKPVAALVDTSTFYVSGYFEETKLPRIHVGDRVEVHVMGEDRLLYGHVDSFASGIEDRDRAVGSSLLANVNPTFNWVRLAQRVPVRVTLDAIPTGMKLVAGRTASVSVIEGSRLTPAADPAPAAGTTP